MALSNFGEMIDQAIIKINLSGVEDPGLRQKVRNGINSFYSLVHSLWPIDATLRTDTFTWTSGASFNVLTASGVTRWRGMPFRVKGASDSYQWYQVDPREIYDRRVTSGTGSNWEEDAGQTRRVFASDMTNLYVVDALTGETVTLIHWQDPAKLTSTTDVPLLPSDLFMLPVYGAVKTILSAANNQQRSKWAQVQPMRAETEAEDMFNIMWERLKDRAARSPEVKEQGDLGPLGEASVGMMEWRRGGRLSRWNEYYPRW